MSRTADKPRRWAGLRSNRGQVLALYSIALPVLLGVMALALDGGKLFVSRIHLQNAADASALASAQDLQQCWTGCDAATEAIVRAQVETDVNLYSGYNHGPTNLGQCHGAWFAESQFERETDGDSGDGNCYLWPYITSDGIQRWDEVEVRLRKDVNLDFAGIVGFHNPSHSWARGVGSYKPSLLVTTYPGVTTAGIIIPGQTHTTIVTGGVHTTTDPDTTVTNTTTTTSFVGGTGGVAFLKSPDCASDPGGAALQWSGADSTLRSIIVNGGFDIPGANTHASDHIFLGKKGVSGCELSGKGAQITQITGPFAALDWPIPPPNPAPPTGCLDTGANGSISAGWLSSHAPGVYCWTAGNLMIKANGATFDGYSFFAPSISISSNGMIFNPALKCGTRTILFDAYAGDFTMSGNSSAMNGDIYAPNGNIVVSGGASFAGCGFMEAWKLIVAGNFAGYSGTGPGDGGSITTTTNTTTTVIPGGTHTTTDPSSTVITTDPDTVIPGSTGPGSTVTATTSTSVGLGE